MVDRYPPLAPGRKPVVGHTLSVLRDPLGTLERWGDTQADVVRAQVGGRQICLVSAPAGVREVLTANSDAYRKAELVRERLGTLQGGSLVLLEGNEWRERRKTLQPAFTRDRVTSAGALTTQYATEMVDGWPTEREIRIDQQARDLSLSILAQALFGLDLRGEDTPIHRAADDILARMDLRSVSTYLPEWVPTPTNRRFRRAVETLHDRLDETVRTAGDSPDGGLLSTMVAAGLPPETIRDELIAFLFAGFDSTATALVCTLGLIADNPDIQSELATELDGVTPTPEDVDDLSLLDAVVRESLRLYPPQYLLFREPTESVTLQGYRIDGGTTVVLPPWVLHRDQRFWTDPEAFRPRRWLDNDHDRPEYAYFPYGSGPRHCLGMRLAQQTLRLVVVVICQRRRLESDASVSVTAGPTLALDGGVSLRAPRR